MANDLDALLAEVDIRAGDGTGLWTGRFQLEISDPELCRRLASALRALTSRHHTLQRTYRRWRSAVDADKTEDVLEARASAVFRAVAALVDGGTDG